MHTVNYAVGRRWLPAGLVCGLLAGCGGGGGTTPPMMTTPPPVGGYVDTTTMPSVGTMPTVTLPQPSALPATAPRSSTPPLPASAYQITAPVTDTVTAAGDGVALGGDTAAPTHAMVTGDIAPAAGESVVSFNSRRADDPDDPDDPDQRAATAKQGYAVTVAADAMLTVTRATAVNVVLGANAAGNAIINRGAITVDGSGIALRALSEGGAGDAHAINAGDITVIGSSDASEPRLAGRVVVAGVGKRAAPFDDTHIGEAVNMPGATIRVTGTNNDRIDGLHVEVGSGHLSRLVNYGMIDIQARGARALSAQTLWGTTQSHNFGRITMRGENSVGLYAGSCAAWAVPDGCDGRFDVLRPDGLSANFFPGDAYARNHRGGMITTDGRRGYGIRVRPLRSGRAFAINDGGIITTGRFADGLNAVGYGGTRDNEVLTPDTSDHDFVYALNTGTIETSGQRAHGVNARHNRGGDVTVTNTGGITVADAQSIGIAAAAFGNTVTVTPCIRIDGGGARVTVGGDCSRSVAAGDINIVNAATGVITARNNNARGEGGIGIDASSDGGDIVITNAGTINAKQFGIRAGALPASRAGARDPVRAAADGDITITNSGDIIADGLERRGVRTGVGIAAVSDGGDISITHTGTITANAVGIRAQTTSTGTITINATGDIAAPTPLEVIGGDGNSIRAITPPLTRAAAALDRAQDGFGDTLINDADGAAADTLINGVGGVGGVGHGHGAGGVIAAVAGHAVTAALAGDGVRFGVRHPRRFARVDYRRADASGWRAAAGATFTAAGVAFTPALLYGEGVARARVASVAAERTFRWHGVALQLTGGGHRRRALINVSDDDGDGVGGHGDGGVGVVGHGVGDGHGAVGDGDGDGIVGVISGGVFTVAYHRTRARTDTRVRLPGFALNLRAPPTTTDQLRLAAAIPVAGGALNFHLTDTRADHRHHRAYGLRFTLPW